MSHKSCPLAKVIVIDSLSNFHPLKEQEKNADSGGGGSSFGSPFGNPLSMSTPGNRRSLQDVDALGLFLQGKSSGRHLSRCISDDVRRRSTASLISSSTYQLNHNLSSTGMCILFIL
ncbi:unnamed protein product [Lepeophtheirus salmonis]|uniref:(salmon louse) hypothetical protein n=2 Tax=Lepeophtheirus salmonis TaxID=72036 RepID=A0A7R8D772_LEPSM|nr:unnamed protein product [Lepeophtheirus salmonis]CAF3023378.1 unnamed protein product [Lepeophtheirus salmonis]